MIATTLDSTAIPRHFPFDVDDLPSFDAFISENKLIEVVLSNLGIFRNGQTDWVASEEIEIGAGTVDILLGKTQNENLSLRVSNRNPVNSSSSYALILNCLYINRPLTLETICRKSGMAREKVLYLLSQLVDIGLCFKSVSNTYTRSPSTNHFSGLISIEGKLQNWRKALYQAHRNRLFSTYSYVVLDAKYARPAINNLNMFSNNSIGLAIAVAETCEVIIISRPNSARPISGVLFTRAKEILLSRILEHRVIMSEDVKNAILS